MTKEEYILECKRINESIAALDEEKLTIKAAYIQEHSKFKIGDKVALITEDRPHPFRKDQVMPYSKTEAFVKTISEYNGVINYGFWKTKKDGSRSNHHLYQTTYDRIELIEAAKPPQS